MAAGQGSVRQPDFVDPSPWNLATLPFLVALVGCMPASVEISALTSLWVQAKRQDRQTSRADVLFDSNTGFVASAVLALCFLALACSSSTERGATPAGGRGLHPQLMSMYADAIGQWAVPLMAVIAFATMFGTIITVVDGYARACAESVRLLRGRPSMTRRDKHSWITGISIVGLVILVWMSAGLADMLRFAMMSAFITAPVFAWLNFALVRAEHGLSRMLRTLSYAGLVFLGGFTVISLLNLLGLVG